MMKKGIITLGEALIDFIPIDKENTNYKKSAGGAPANVAVGLARLGADVHFIGKVGEDSLGHFLKETLKGYHVNTSFMVQTETAKTGLVLVTHDEHGDRSFEFYIQPSADALLREADINSLPFEYKKILHIGSISLIQEPVKSATWRAIKLATEKGMYLSYDPNLRMSLWPSEMEARETIKSVLPFADILKLSEEELFFLAGENSEHAIKQIADEYDIPLIFVTRGADGSLCYCNNGFIEVPAIDVKAVDTTGAGDAFVSAVLYQIDQLVKDVRTLTVEDLKEIATFASVSGGLAASTQGAMSALPTRVNIDSYLK